MFPISSNCMIIPPSWRGLGRASNLTRNVLSDDMFSSSVSTVTIPALPPSHAASQDSLKYPPHRRFRLGNPLCILCIPHQREEFKADVTCPLADGRLAIGFDEMHPPAVVVLEVHQDLGHCTSASFGRVMELVAAGDAYRGIRDRPRWVGGAGTLRRGCIAPPSCKTIRKVAN
jgi:hypothetical protein